uniref:PRA1 family protein n=1 Tax=Crocodylus porosus TaxID=8502 RepID=A0A7M4F9X4_CROPO
MEVQVAPLWPWNNFFPRHDSFTQLDLRDMPKWSHHVVNNPLYYQTNHVVLAASIVSVMGFLHPLNMLLGSAVVVFRKDNLPWVIFTTCMLHNICEAWGSSSMRPG